MNDICVVPLSQGKFAIVDAEDYERVSQYKWCVYQFATSGPYGGRSSRADGKTTTMYLHRFVIDAPDGMVVDHANHNGLDNRKENLRLCSRTENRHNLNGAMKNNKSGYLGVGQDKRTGRWRARIRVGSRLICLGFYSTVTEAAKARDRAALHYQGEYASLNFPLVTGGKDG